MPRNKIKLGFKKPRLKFKMDKRLSKTLIPLLIVLAIAGVLYGIKGWFVAAVVNGRPISRWSLDRQLEKQMGKAVLENEIVKILILQAGKKEKVVVSREELDAKIEEIKEQFSSQGTDLETLLASQGQTSKDLEEQIKVQLIVEKIVGKDIEVTDEQIAEYFETSKDFFPEDATLEEMKEDIQQDLFQQKLGEKFQPWLTQLKEDSKVYYFLKL